MKVFIYTNDNGGVSVVIPAPGVPLNLVASKDIPNGKTYHMIESDQLPKRDEYRNSWAILDGRVIHDIAKAREIKRDLLRNERKNLFVGLDADSIRAMEENDNPTLNEIKRKKKILRDIPADPRIEAASTVGELNEIKILL